VFVDGDAVKPQGSTWARNPIPRIWDSKVGLHNPEACPGPSTRAVRSFVCCHCCCCSHRCPDNHHCCSLFLFLYSCVQWGHRVPMPSAPCPLPAALCPLSRAQCALWVLSVLCRPVAPKAVSHLRHPAPGTPTTPLACCRAALSRMASAMVMAWGSAPVTGWWGSSLTKS